MTTYGTNPTSSYIDSSSPMLEYISRDKQAGIATRRPWKLMLHPRAISFPRTLAAAAARIRKNFAVFQTNYAIVALLVVFISLLWRPVALIVLIALVAAWIFLYFLRDEPLTILGRSVDDLVVLIVMSVLTVAVLLLTDAKTEILAAVSIGAAALLAHAAMRKTDDLFSDEEERAGLLSGASEVSES